MRRGAGLLLLVVGFGLRRFLFDLVTGGGGGVASCIHSAFDGVAGIVGGRSRRIGSVRSAFGHRVAGGGDIASDRRAGFRRFLLRLAGAGGKADGRGAHPADDERALLTYFRLSGCDRTSRGDGTTAYERLDQSGGAYP